MEVLKKIGNNLAKLINVKTLVTFAVTGVFVYLALRGEISPDVVMPVVTMVISFYFGTQYEKAQKEIIYKAENEANDKEDNNNAIS
jgi:uncharacterized membrane protein